jgi:spore maturation protein SpmA
MKHPAAGAALSQVPASTLGIDEDATPEKSLGLKKSTG